nr:putative reverse transcriptase domain-containing protein [Tanacetum cinerariifolium]
AQISATKEDDKPERKQVKDVPIVQDFLEVFPEDLPELLSDYNCDIRYHPGKENVVADALSRKEWDVPLRVQALIMTISLDLPKQIRAAQIEALKPENLKKEDVGGMIRTPGEMVVLIVEIRDISREIVLS